MKLIELFKLHHILVEIRTGKMGASDTMKLIKNIREIRKALNDFETLRDDFLQQDGDKKQMEEVLNQELEKEVYVPIEKLGEEAFNAMIEGNNLSIGQIILCEDILKG